MKTALRILVVLLILTGSLLSILPAKPAQATTWWNTSWLYREKVTFANGSISENITNSLNEVSLNSTVLNFAHVRSDGFDIRFVDADDTTELKYYRASWNGTAQTGDFIFQVPQIDASSNTDYVWMYYGNAGASDGENKAFTNDIVLNDPLWSSRLTTSPFQSVDSYSHNNTVTGATWGPQGRTFVAASNQFISCGRDASLLITGDITIEGWINLSEYDANYHIIGQAETNGVAGLYYVLAEQTTGKIYFFRGNGTVEAAVISTSAVGTGNRHFYITMIGTEVKIYFGGSLDKTGTLSTTIGDTGENINIGKRQDTLYPLNGAAGEFRIYNRGLSPNEGTRNYLTSKWRYLGGSTYTTLGTEEAYVLSAPTNFTAVTGNNITLTWTPNIFATGTVILMGNIQYPASITDGTVVYSGGGNSADVGAYDTGKDFFFTAWSQNGTLYSVDSATTELESTSMAGITAQIATFNGYVSQGFIFLVVATILGLALLKKDNIFLLGLAFPVCMVYGLNLAANATSGSTLWVAGIIIAVIGTYCLIKVAMVGLEGTLRRRKAK